MFNPYNPLPDRQRNWLGAAGIVGILIVWAAVCASGMIPPYKLPAPWVVLEAFGTMIANGSLITATLWSTGRVVVATLLTMLVGIPVGVAMGGLPKVNAVLSPILDPLKSSPTPALLPLLIMWAGIGEETKILFLFISSIVYLAPLVRDSLRSVPQSHWNVAVDLGATKFEAIRMVLLPLALPRIWDAVGVCLALCWTYIPMSEFIASDASAGLGNLIQTAQRFSATDQVLTGIFSIVIVALLSSRLMDWGKRKLFPWEGL